MDEETVMRKVMKEVYLLIHTYEFCDSIETKFLGIYSTREKAEEALK